MNRTPDEYKQLKSLFNSAVELSTKDRDELFESSQVDIEMRREIEQMIAAISDEHDSLETPAIEHLIDTSTPNEIGGYRIVREIGIGGMGTVYEAVREAENFSQRAALKVIRSGMNNDLILKRFRSEQKILASLEHPNIAHFLDGGTTNEKLPYYSMEYIEGSSIVEHCKENNVSERARLELFREVCSAVSYAHSQLVIHRDLKPSNIMVTHDGTPKLLDFGIAKLLEDDGNGATETQFGMMTPQYASPEQIRGEKVSTISDVYSLGMILHEMLTGKLPYTTADKTLAQIIEFVSDKTIPNRGLTNQTKGKPANLIKGDLGRITGKALQKDPARRYTSVESLSDDVGRFLSGQPITARPDSVGYRVKKFVQRNRVAVSISFLTFITLLGGIAATYWQAQKAESQRILAEKRFAEVRNIANNVVFKYHDEIAKLEGSTAVRQMLVSDAMVYLDTIAADSAGDISLQRELGLAYLKLGDVQGKLYSANTGDTDGAHASYQKAVSMLEAVANTDPHNAESNEALLGAYDTMLSFLHRVSHTTDTREQMFTKTSELMERMSNDFPDDIEMVAQRASLYIRIGDFYGHISNREGLEKKLSTHIRAKPLIDRLEAVNSNDPAILITIARFYQRIGTDLMWLGESSESTEPERARDLFSQAVGSHEKMIGYVDRVEKAEAGNPNTNRMKFAAYTSISDSLSLFGDTTGAMIYAEKALQLAEQNQAADAGNREAEQDVANGIAQFGRIYAKTNDNEKALEKYKKAFEIFITISDRDRKNTLISSRLYDICAHIKNTAEKLGRVAEGQACSDIVLSHMQPKAQ